MSRRSARVQVAARNNAAWCDAVCRAHGRPGRYTPEAWVNPRRTPLFYPDAVTLTPEAAAESVLAGIDNSPGCTIKDSFANLDLTAAGFAVLFDAQWIYRPAGLPPPVASQTWSPVATPAELCAWEEAWRGDDGPRDLFRTGLLADQAILVLGLHGADGYVAGAIANRSDGAVGISNVFIREGDLRDAWAGALAVVTGRWGELPMVGYEHDAELTAPIEHGFTPIGPLRVWLRE